MESPLVSPVENNNIEKINHLNKIIKETKLRLMMYRDMQSPSLEMQVELERQLLYATVSKENIEKFQGLPITNTANTLIVRTLEFGLNKNPDNLYDYWFVAITSCNGSCTISDVIKGTADMTTLLFSTRSCEFDNVRAQFRLIINLYCFKQKKRGENSAFATFSNPSPGFQKWATVVMTPTGLPDARRSTNFPVLVEHPVVKDMAVVDIRLERKGIRSPDPSTLSIRPPPNWLAPSTLTIRPPASWLVQ